MSPGSEKRKEGIHKVLMIWEDEEIHHLGGRSNHIRAGTLRAAPKLDGLPFRSTGTGHAG